MVLQRIANPLTVNSVCGFESHSLCNISHILCDRLMMIRISSKVGELNWPYSSIG